MEEILTIRITSEKEDINDYQVYSMKMVPFGLKYQIVVHLYDKKRDITELRILEPKTELQEDFDIVITGTMIYNQHSLQDYMIFNSQLWILWMNQGIYQVTYSPISNLPTGSEYQSFPVSVKVKTASYDIGFPYPSSFVITDVISEDIMTKLFDNFGIYVIETVFQQSDIPRDKLVDLINQKIKKLAKESFKKNSIQTDDEADFAVYQAWNQIWQDCKDEFLNLYQGIGIGIYHDNSIGLINETGTSLFRASDPFECIEYLPKSQRHLFTQTLLEPNLKHLLNQPLMEDILLIIDQIKFLNQSIDKEFLIEYQNSLYLKDPHTVAQECLKNLNHFHFTCLQKEFNRIKDPENAIEVILSFLSLETKEDIKSSPVYSQFLIDSIVTNILSARYKFSRELLLFLIYVCENIKISHNLKRKLEKLFFTNLIEHLRVYKIYDWLSLQTNAYEISYIGIFYQEQIRSNNNKSLMLDTGFKFYSYGSDQIYFSALALISTKLSFIYNINSALEMANLLYEKESFDLLEIFSSSLLKEFPIFKYYLGITSLNKKQLLKARDYFIQSANLIEDLDPSFYKYFNVQDTKQLLYDYFESIRLKFEKFHEFNLEFALLAYNETFEEPKKNKLQAIMFYSHLEVENFDLAYLSLILQQGERKEISFEFFIKTLIKKGYSFKILKYPYHNELVLLDQTLAKIAKKTNIGESPHPYEILFSIHTRLQIFLKAAEYSYQHSKKLEELLMKEESQSLEIILKMSDLLLNSLNSMEFSSQKFFIFEHKIIKIQDIKREYLKNLARIKLYTFEHKIITNPTISLLIDYGFYDLAILIAQNDLEKILFIFEQLTVNVIRSIYYKKKFKIYLEDSYQMLSQDPWEILYIYYKRFLKEQQYIKKIIILTIQNMSKRNFSLPEWFDEEGFSIDEVQDLDSIPFQSIEILN